MVKIRRTLEESSTEEDQTSGEQEVRLTGVRRATPAEIDVGTWILVKVFSNHNRHRIFLCTVVEDDPDLIRDLFEGQYHVHFVKQYRNTIDSFTFGERPASDIDFSDILGIVDQPILIGEVF